MALFSNTKELSFWEHVEEFRLTLIRILLVILVGFGFSLFFYQQIFELLTTPLIESSHALANNINVSIEHSEYPAQVNQQSQAVNSPLYVFSPTEGLVTTFRVSFWVAAVVMSPIWLFFVLQFIGPAFKANHQKAFFPFLILSCCFLSMGILFGYFVTIPLANGYLQAFNSGLGVNLWSLSSYLDYTLLLLLANGFVFELSVILLFLVHFGFLTEESLKKKRPFMVVFSFVLAAVLTPPDVFSQVLMAIPLLVFYEFSILYSKFYKR